MKKGFFLVLMASAVGLLMLTSKAWAGSLEDRVAALEASVAQLQSEVAILKANAAVTMADRGYLKLDETTVRNGAVGPHVIFDGVNLHLQNGSGESVMGGQAQYNPPNGRGNLIIGYDEVDLNDPLEPGDRGGSHNLVIGYANKFPGIYSLVHGWGNVARGGYSATIAGDSNNAGEWNAVIGGYYNVADGIESVIIGGNDNHAIGYKSVVIGGELNQSNGTSSVVSGGLDRQALGEHDWVAGSLWENY